MSDPLLPLLPGSPAATLGDGQRQGSAADLAAVASPSGLLIRCAWRPPRKLTDSGPHCRSTSTKRSGAGQKGTPSLNGEENCVCTRRTSPWIWYSPALAARIEMKRFSISCQAHEKKDLSIVGFVFSNPAGSARQPPFHGFRHLVGGVLLDEMAGRRDRHQGPILLQVFPGAVQAAGH